MPSLTSLIKTIQSSPDGSNTLELYEQVFEYCTSSDVIDDYESALRQLDQTVHTDTDLWLLFDLFHLVTDRRYYYGERRDRLCRFWLPMYQSFVEQLLPEQTDGVEDNVDYERLIVLKYLLANMIEMQKTSESLDYVLNEELQFQYFAIIKRILSLLTNSFIVARLENDDMTNIQLEWQPNSLSNITNITTTLVIWMVLKLTMMLMKTADDFLTLVKHDKSIKQTLLTSIKLIKNNKPIILFLYVSAALLMNEQEIKEIINDPTDIITTSIQQVLVSDNEGTNFSHHGMHILDMLIALKAYIQHDPMKLTFIANDGLRLLIDIATKAVLEGREEVELLAFECLLAMSFNKDAADSLRNNELFMSRIRDPDGSSTSLKRTLDAIQWKLEGEDQFKRTPRTEKDSDKLDLMISYSWNDQPLVRDISTHLSEEYHYRIKLGDNQMTDSRCQVMAQAIDQSKMILICMSEAYRSSETCRIEAEYARDRKKPIIPLIVKEVERDGWLGSISTGKIGIDFVNQDFSQAIKLLIKKIQRTEQTLSHRKRSRVIPNAAKTKSMVSWSDEDVRAFLHHKKLDQIALLTEDMNGEELIALIDRCIFRTNYWMMFDRLNQEMEIRFQQTLPLSVFNRFLHQSQKYYTQTASF